MENAFAEHSTNFSIIQAQMVNESILSVLLSGTVYWSEYSHIMNILDSFYSSWNVTLHLYLCCLMFRLLEDFLWCTEHVHNIHFLLTMPVYVSVAHFVYTLLQFVFCPLSASFFSFIFCFPPLLSSCWKTDFITTVRVLAQTGLSNVWGSVSFLIL